MLMPRATRSDLRWFAVLLLRFHISPDIKNSVALWLGGIYENVTLEKPDINFAHTAHQKTILSKHSLMFLCALTMHHSRALLSFISLVRSPWRMFTEWRKENSCLSLSCARAHQKNKERWACRFSLSTALQNSPLLLFRAIKLNLEHFSAAPRAACAGY